MNSLLHRTSHLLAALLLASLAACDRSASPTSDGPPSSHRPVAGELKLAIPQHGIYQGAYIDWGDKEDAVTFEAIDRFDKMVGKHQAIIASSSYWGEQTFPTENLDVIVNHGSIPLVFWSPWDKPYEESKGPDKYSLTSIIAGEHDAYIDMWAEKARDFGFPMIVSFANEMNGEWFPWSGVLYGGSKILPGTQPYKYEGPETFKKAYRHVVDRVRAKGAKNVQWVLHLMNYSLPQEPWNLAAEYYPGPDYCDWLGFSLYGVQFADDEWAPYYHLLDWPVEEMRRIDATKPVMVCEWGVGEFPTLGSKADWFRDAFKQMKDPKYANLKACVYWHERWQNDDGRYSNLHVNSSPEALAAYRQGVADPFYLADPVYEKTK